MCSLSFCWCNEHLTIFNWTFAHQKIKERDFLNLDWMVGISLVEGKAVYTLFYALFCLKMQIRLGLGELHFFWWYISTSHHTGNSSYRVLFLDSLELYVRVLLFERTGTHCFLYPGLLSMLFAVDFVVFYFFPYRL